MNTNKIEQVFWNGIDRTYVRVYNRICKHQKRENSNSVRQHHNELLSLKHQKQKWKIPYALFIITYIFLFFKAIKQFCLDFPNF